MSPINVVVRSICDSRKVAVTLQMEIDALSVADTYDSWQLADHAARWKLSQQIGSTAMRQATSLTNTTARPASKETRILYTVCLGRGTQAVRERSAKPLCVGSIPTRASTKKPNKNDGFYAVRGRTVYDLHTIYTLQFLIRTSLTRLHPRGIVLLRDRDACVSQ
jgi:hypothetical protein